MLKRRFPSDEEEEEEASTSEEADSSEISKPATKVIRIDDSPKSSSDKCIQVDTGECNDESQPQPPGHSVKQKVDSSGEEIIINLVSSNADTHAQQTPSSSSGEAPTCPPNSASTNESTIASSATTAPSSSSALDNTCEIDNSDVVVYHVPDASDQKAPTHLINDEDVDDPSATSSSGITSIAQVNDEPDGSKDNSVSSNVCTDEPDFTPSTSSGRTRPIQGALKVAGRKPKIKRSVNFNGVTVYYFRRSQGFTCVPSQGGSTLGMENTHSYFRSFTLETHAEERKRAHREILLRQKRFAKMNKHSSTSESEDDSYDDLSDLSDIDLENDNCYFLQPVPIKQRRALLRASGVRKIETFEKEECRDIRLSREFCGCDCQVYCNPDSCACYLGGIKCQVDRMSFPCGCSRDGCKNTIGRIEFNPMRVRTHFIQTLMKIEMEKKQQQQQQQIAGTTSSNSSSRIASISSTDSSYCAVASTSTGYSPPISSQCNQSMQQQQQHSPQDMYVMAMQNNHHSHHHYVADSSHMLIPNGNNYPDPSMFNNEYSPDNSSYSENSDYTTSDDFDDELADKTAVVYPPHQSTYISNSQPEMHVMHAMSSGMSPVSSCSTSNTLPPFPSINSSCDLTGGSVAYKDTGGGHCHSYQDTANSMHPLNHHHHYSAYSAMADSLPQHASVYSYDIHGSPHYGGYTTTSTNGFHKEEDSFASVVAPNTTTAAVTTSHELSAAECIPSLEQVNGNISSSSSTQHHQPVTPESNSLTTTQQQYIDLSLSIASSSSAESLLSAANTSDEDSRLTPVSFTHIQPLSSSSSFYSPVTDSSGNLCQSSSSFDQSYSQKGDIPECTVVVAPLFHEMNEADAKSSSDSSSPESNLSPSDNFGEIIKKSIVETVSA